MDIVLLHGFTETPTIWKKLKERLVSAGHRCFAPSLSGNNPDFQDSSLSMESMALSVMNGAKEAGMSHFTVFGHSMGGYVALQMLRMFPNQLMGLGLLQSTALSDGDEKKNNRTQLAKLLREKGSGSFLNTFIPNLFAPANVTQLQKVIDELKQDAETIPAIGLAAQTIAMRDRPNSLDLLTSTKTPLLFLPGRLDPLISTEVIYAQAAHCKSSFQIDFLENSGHMGIFEEYDRTLAAMNNFMDFAVFHQ